MEEISLSPLVLERGHAEQGHDGRREVAFSHSTSSDDSIFRIPGLFKMRNEKAYTPYKFSIGPWHFGKTQLLRTGQKLKESFLERLISRFPNPEVKKRELEGFIRNVHEDARKCYEGGDVYEGENTKVAKEEFEKILLLDGCFIIELFHENHENAKKVSKQRNESVLFSEGMIQVIYHDLLLLDNQIPWFVLEGLFERMEQDDSDWNYTLRKQASRFLGRAIYHYDEVPKPTRANFENILHLVDFVWRFLCLSSTTEKVITTLEYRTPIPSASRLKEAGVKFQKATSRNILDVKFNEGVLEIPRLVVTPSTETIFRNLIIFEQCSVPSIPRVTCYAILLDCLVDTSDDVDLMCRADILNNWLNPEETANFLNRVRDNTPIKDFLYAELCNEVNRYCKKIWPTWRAALIHNYFTKPWAIVSVLFAMIILFFTIMQVFYK